MNVWARQAKRNEVYDNGKLVEPPGFDGWKLRIRPANKWNVHFKRAMVRMHTVDPGIADYLARSQQDGYVPTLADRTLDESIQRGAFIEGCVAPWDFVTDEDGNALDFTPENAHRVFCFFPQLYEFAFAFASDERNFPELGDDAKEAIAAGNSEPASHSRTVLGGSLPDTSPLAASLGAPTRRKK
jgi:hypothetical protein